MNTVTKAMCGLALCAASACAPSSGAGNDSAVASDDGNGIGPAGRFEGTWNYDVPDRANDINIGRVVCPGTDGGAGTTLVIPQVSSIVFTRTGASALQGHTSEGCSWTYAVHDGTAELDPPTQTCDNPSVRVSYTLTRWSIAVDGPRETEVVEGTAHLPGGDCAFTLDNGRRTAVDPNSSADPTVAFAGAWSDVPPDPQTNTDVAQVVCPNPAGPPTVTYEPRVGAMTFTKTGDHALQGLTEQGCALTFTVQGDIAELDPAGQSCAASGVSTTVTHWALASDGQHEFDLMSGVRHTASGDCFVLLGSGERARP